jgi:hypothetical protein
MNKLIFFSLLPALMLMVPNVSASVSQELSEEEKESGFYRENGSVISNTKERPAINPDFAPDEDCNLAYELKCIPGQQQECPEGYHHGDDVVCSPKECQEGYHGEDDDETGLCYPDEEGCSSDSMVLIERYNGKGLNCSYLGYICDEAEYSSKDYCVEWRE